MKKYIEPEIFVIAFDVEDSVSFGFGDNNQGVSGLGGKAPQFFDEDVFRPEDEGF